MTITEAEPQVEVQAPPGDAAVLEDIVPYESVPEVSWHFSDIRQIFTDDKEHGYESAAHHLRWIKKFVGEVALFGAISAAGGGVTAVVATLNSPSRGAIGPQYTHITPTRDNALTIDFGLGQQIILPLSGENGIGAKVEPIGTPDLVNIKLGDPTAQQDATTLLENALGNPDQYTSEGKRAVAGHGKGWFEL
ncbi:MAG TPA: hypothetical protein VLE74_03480, partial [Candidatus Saccharimonadales bacterium]|nr:hypothetical protein [Candidatus Saccharimonadales bacterium]